VFTRGYISIYFWAMASRCVTSIFGIAPGDHRAIFQSRGEGSSCGRNVEDVHQLIWNTAAVTTRICIAPTWKGKSQLRTYFLLKKTSQRSRSMKIQGEHCRMTTQAAAVPFIYKASDVEKW
jgi:hypothetical protein